MSLPAGPDLKTSASAGRPIELLRSKPSGSVLVKVAVAVPPAGSRLTAVDAVEAGGELEGLLHGIGVGRAMRPTPGVVQLVGSP